MRIIYFIVALLMLCGYAQAQEVRVGFRAGANFSQWSNSQDMEYDPIVGLHAGPFVNISTSHLISYELGLYFSRKGTKYHKESQGRDNVHYKISGKHKSVYLDLPIFIRLTLIKGLSLNVGPQLSLLLIKKKKGKALLITNDEETITVIEGYDDITKYNKLDMAIVAGVAYQFNNGLNINASYDYGLYKVYKEKWSPEVYNRAVKISLGYLF